MIYIKDKKRLELASSFPYRFCMIIPILFCTRRILRRSSGLTMYQRCTACLANAFFENRRQMGPLSQQRDDREQA